MVERPGLEGRLVTLNAVPLQTPAVLNLPKFAAEAGGRMKALEAKSEGCRNLIETCRSILRISSTLLLFVVATTDRRVRGARYDRPSAVFNGPRCFS